jgi:hypothetical protein
MFGCLCCHLQASSYGAGTETSGKVDVQLRADAVKGRHVLLVDDLVRDTQGGVWQPGPHCLLGGVGWHLGRVQCGRNVWLHRPSPGCLMCGCRQHVGGMGALQACFSAGSACDVCVAFMY